MDALNRQQICAALGVSESTIRRLEHLGLPYTPVGSRSKRYDLDECKQWLRQNEGALTAKLPPLFAPITKEMRKMEREYVESAKKSKLRAYPSEK